MLTYFQAAILGIVQGTTELFPISSLGHSVVLPRFFGWSINQNDPFFLVFLVATHTATAFVLFLFFLNDWKRITKGVIRSLRQREIREEDADAKLAWLLIVGTIPAGILGLLFEESFKKLFASPQLVAGVLVLNGFMLFAAEVLRRKRKEEHQQGSDERIAKLRFSQAIQVGVLQGLALIPGFSRTGATITGGLLTGLSHEDAARYSFLLATPVIAAAALLKLPELLFQNNGNVFGATIVGAVFSGVCAYLSVRFLTKYFETKNLTPFALYCIGIGSILSLIFFLG